MQRQRVCNIGAVGVVALGLAARLWAAHGIFLNPDEALHFRLANQSSLALAYQQSLTASHPPLLTLVLYDWRVLGTSELWLRLPSVLAGVVFCWMFYLWLRNAAGPLAGFIGASFVALLPPVVLLGAEVRQYSLLLAYLASAVFFLDAAFDKKLPGNMAAFSACLYLAMLSHYSAFLFVAALGGYALIRILEEHPPAALITIWAIGQTCAGALAIVLYKTHIAKLGAGESRTAVQGWMSEFFLRRSYYDPTHDHRLIFLASHSFGIFQYFFGQLAVGDVMGVVFIAGIFFLFRRMPGQDQRASRRIGIFLMLTFAVAAAASMTHTYPYGGTRHMTFLIIPGIAGVGIGLTGLAGDKAARSLAAAGIILLSCLLIGKTRPPKMDRSDQSTARMKAAVDFIQKQVPPTDLIFTDYQSDLILGHYLCRQRVISFESSPSGYEQFSCADHRIVSMDYKEWQFWADNFVGDWDKLTRDYRLKPGDSVWVMQTGWLVNLPEDLRKRYPELRGLPFQSFGDNIKIFKMTVGRALPGATR